MKQRLLAYHEAEVASNAVYRNIVITQVRPVTLLIKVTDVTVTVQNHLCPLRMYHLKRMAFTAFSIYSIAFSLDSWGLI